MEALHGDGNIILVTGFEPFGGEIINPSWEAVERLDDRIGDALIVKRRLPVSFERSGPLLIADIEKLKPRSVVCVGQAGGRSVITPEVVGINKRCGTDNDGKTFNGERIYAGAPDAYFATLPIDEMIESMRLSLVPSHPSYSAGVYVCNNLLFELLHYSARFDRSMMCGFIHIPYLPEQVASKPQPQPSMDMRLCVKGLNECLSVISRSAAFIKAP